MCHSESSGIKCRYLCSEFVPDRGMYNAFNQELECVREYDRCACKQLVRMNLPLLNSQQKDVLDTLMKTIHENSTFFFVIPVRTGNTSLTSLILTTVHVISETDIAVVSSRIVVTLLEGFLSQLMTHSAMKLPLRLQTNEIPTLEK
ncbi:unnamed protein product [Euphydryas editha]|uniref:Uncharacterized protein n=1 Tax=Euphydryas editha TaxID=104508 RepID=A0AAU9V7X8_EUPED|nr:unnamed protein product [Euphydryas editha]